MKCIHCQGQMRRGLAPFSMDRRGYHIAWDAIPAWVCSQCGEPYFEAREVTLIQQALTAIDQQMAQLNVDAA